MNLIKPYYQLFYPDNMTNLSGQWSSCLGKLLNYISDGKSLPFRINIFAHTKGYKNYAFLKQFIGQTITSLFGQNCPPYAILSQTPEDPFKVIIEAGFYSSEEAEIEYGKLNDQLFCRVGSGSYSEFWFIGILASGKNLNVLDFASTAFSDLLSLFRKTGIGMDQIVRQWNYIGNILAHKSVHGNKLQNYQMFNEIRYDYYSKNRKIPGFPAATGVGMNIDGFILDCYAIKGDNDLKVISISNPDQYNSYQYEQEVLIGKSPIQGNNKKHPPQFERAKLISTGDDSRLLISGTASIKGQANVGKGDVIHQTRVTIENIALLSSMENLKKHYPELTAFPNKYCYVRVYVKEKTDIARIRPVCESYFGEVPITYVQADICRDDLLVEIEAEKTT